MRLDAAASSALRSALSGPARPATWLGVTPAALYLRMASTPGVVALLAHDAVRLPCALVLPTTAGELALTCLADASGDPMIGEGGLTWTGPAGPVDVRAVREWAPATVCPGTVAAGGLDALLVDALPVPSELDGWGSAVQTATAGAQPRVWGLLGIDGALLTLLTTEPSAAVARLLGRGPGLTPAGDDVLAGFLLGARAVGLDVGGARAAVAAMAPARTTALSAALLRHAARGECISEVAAVVANPSGPALSALLRVGHTSGAALATGLATAAQAALSAGTASEVA